MIKQKIGLDAWLPDPVEEKEKLGAMTELEREFYEPPAFFGVNRAELSMRLQAHSLLPNNTAYSTGGKILVSPEIYHRIKALLDNK